MEYENLMDFEIPNELDPVSEQDWTLVVRSKADRGELAGCMNNSIWDRCGFLDQLDWENMGIYQSKKLDIEFPFYRNQQRKIVLVKSKIKFFELKNQVKKHSYQLLEIQALKTLTCFLVPNESAKDPDRLSNAIREFSASLAIRNILFAPL